MATPQSTETVTLQLPSGESVDAVVPSGMSDDQVRTLMQQKHPEFYQQQARSVESPITTPPLTTAARPAAPRPLSTDPGYLINRLTGHPEYQGQPITAGTLAAGAVHDPLTIARGFAQGMAQAAVPTLRRVGYTGPDYPIGRTDPEDLAQAGAGLV